MEKSNSKKLDEQKLMEKSKSFNEIQKKSNSNKKNNSITLSKQNVSVMMKKSLAKTGSKKNMSSKKSKSLTKSKKPKSLAKSKSLQKSFSKTKKSSGKKSSKEKIIMKSKSGSKKHDLSLTTKTSSYRKIKSTSKKPIHESKSFTKSKLDSSLTGVKKQENVEPLSKSFVQTEMSKKSSMEKSGLPIPSNPLIESKIQPSSKVNISESNVNENEKRIESRLIQVNVPEKVQKQLDEIIKNLQKNDQDDEWEYFYDRIEWPEFDNDDCEYEWIDEKDIHKYQPEQIIRVDYDPDSKCSIDFKSKF